MTENPSEILSKIKTPYICSSKCKLIVTHPHWRKPKLGKTVGYENNEKRMDSVYSKRVKAGKRRTYFFDVKATRANDYYLTITESRKRFNEESYERHKIFLYKEDFNKFLSGLTESVDYVKTELMPDFDFDAFNHEYSEGEFEPDNAVAALVPSTNGNGMSETSIRNPIPEKEAEEPVISAVVSPEIPVDFSGNGTHEEVDKW